MQVHYVPASAEDREGIARALSDQKFLSAYAAATTVSGLRQGTGALSAHGLVRQPLPGVRVQACTVAGLPCEMMEPAGAHGEGLIVYVHGGGFVRGSLALGRGNASAIAQAARTRVLALGYRQAPEHPFPAAIDDVTAVFLALQEQGHAARRIAVVGESSGGTLAIALSARLADQPARLPAGIVAASPMADLRLQGASWLYNAAHDVADRETGERMVALYLQGRDAAEPLASPVAHDFRDRTPLLLAIGTRETMLSDTEYLASKASEAGSPVQLALYEDMVHGFTRFDIPIAREALASMARWCVSAIEA